MPNTWLRKVEQGMRGRILAGVSAVVLSMGVTAFGTALSPVPAYAQGQQASVQTLNLRQQVRQGLAAVERQAFPAAVSKQIEQAKVLVSVTAAALLARTPAPSEAIVAIGTEAVAAGIPAPVVVASILGAAVRTGVVTPQAAIADTVVAAVGARADGGDAAAAAIVTAMDGKVADTLIGEGLARAATAISATNPVAAAAIAQAVADEGTTPMIATFSVSVANAVGSAQLIAIANGPPRAAAGGHGGGDNGGGNGGGGGTGGLGGVGNILNSIQNLLNRIFDRIGLPPPCIVPSCS